MPTTLTKPQPQVLSQPAVQGPIPPEPALTGITPVEGPPVLSLECCTLRFWLGCALVLAVLHVLDLRLALFRLLGLSGG
jgi:hypothetical protein